MYLSILLKFKSISFPQGNKISLTTLESLMVPDSHTSCPYDEWSFLVEKNSTFEGFYFRVNIKVYLFHFGVLRDPKYRTNRWKNVVLLFRLVSSNWLTCSIIFNYRLMTLLLNKIIARGSNDPWNPHTSLTPSGMTVKRYRYLIRILNYSQ